MAKNKLEEKVAFDYSQYLPEGVSAKDIAKTGGLSPIYGAKEAFEGGFNAVAGFVDRFEILPTQGKDTDNEYTPIMIKVREIKVATKGIRGNRLNREVVDVAAGGDILIPLTGNLKNNKELIAAIHDKKSAHFFVFRVEGQLPIAGKPTDMWVWEVMDTFVTKPREGVYALPPPDVTEELASGALFNKLTGEIVERTVSNSAS